MKYQSVLLSLLLLMSSPSFAQQMVKDYKKLKSALDTNHPPAGHIDLNYCSVKERLGGTPHEQWIYSISFDHFAINHQNGMITTTQSSDVLRAHKADKLVLGKLFVTFSTWPDAELANYQVIIMDYDGELLVKRLYECPWATAVHLWRK